ncbi:MAG: class I SAM-dependent methyltransferase [Halioglobus sp.]
MIKYKIIDTLRATGTLKFVDWGKYWLHRINVLPANIRFKRNNPDFPLPPPDLAFDAYNGVDWHNYRDVGAVHASIFADIVKRTHPPGELSILEWGCGPGRLIRNMRGLFDGYNLQLTGTDYNPRTIEWCSKNLPEIDFHLNELMPPLPFPDEQYDLVYCFSVFTHLSEEAQKAWAAELKRLVKPGGVFICTTHGEDCRHLLTSQEDIDTYEAGQVVLKGKYVEGKKWYLAVHPERFVREVLMAGFTDVNREILGEDKSIMQDVWAGTKPDE